MKSIQKYKNHLHRNTEPVLSEHFSGDAIHSIMSSSTDILHTLNEDTFDDAKIANSTQSAKRKILNYLNGDFKIDFNGTYPYIRSRLKALFSLDRHGSSDYMVYNTPKGRLAFRLTHHEATGQNFEQDKAEMNISVFVSYYKYGIRPTIIPYTEYEIKPEFFEEHKEECVNAIVQAVNTALTTGDFNLNDTIAERKDYPEDYVENEPTNLIYNPATKQMEPKNKSKQENLQNNNMINNSKKALYESIMKDVAKIVKKQINESMRDDVDVYEEKLCIDEKIYDDLLDRMYKLYKKGILSKEGYGHVRQEIEFAVKLPVRVPKR